MAALFGPFYIGPMIFAGAAAVYERKEEIEVNRRVYFVDPEARETKTDHAPGDLYDNPFNWDKYNISVQTGDYCSGFGSVPMLPSSLLEAY